MTVEGCGSSSLQGDVRFAEVMGLMGAKVEWHPYSITITGMLWFCFLFLSLFLSPFSCSFGCVCEINTAKAQHVEDRALRAKYMQYGILLCHYWWVQTQ